MYSENFCWASTGSVLLEWVLVLALVSTVMVSLGSGMMSAGPALQNRVTGVLVYQFLSTARQAAMALGTDTVMTVSPTALVLKNGQTQAILTTLFIPHGTTIRSNQNLGFKANGNSKFAGTVWVETGTAQTVITVGVGFGQIRRP
jgi:hypothetical protein